MWESIYRLLGIPRAPLDSSPIISACCASSHSAVQISFWGLSLSEIMLFGYLPHATSSRSDQELVFEVPKGGESESDVRMSLASTHDENEGSDDI